MTLRLAEQCGLDLANRFGDGGAKVGMRLQGSEDRFGQKLESRGDEFRRGRHGGGDVESHVNLAGHHRDGADGDRVFGSDGAAVYGGGIGMEILEALAEAGDG